MTAKSGISKGALASATSSIAFLFYYNTMENTRNLVNKLEEDGVSLEEFRAEMVECYERMPISYMHDILTCALIIRTPETPRLFKGVGSCLREYVRKRYHGPTHIRDFYTATGYDTWRRRMADDMRKHSSFGQIIETVSGQKYHAAIVNAYARWITSTKGMERLDTAHAESPQ